MAYAFLAAGCGRGGRNEVNHTKSLAKYAMGTLIKVAVIGFLVYLVLTNLGAIASSVLGVMLGLAVVGLVLVALGLGALAVPLGIVAAFIGVVCALGLPLLIAVGIVMVVLAPVVLFVKAMA